MRVVLALGVCVPTFVDDAAGVSEAIRDLLALGVRESVGETDAVDVTVDVSDKDGVPVADADAVEDAVTVAAGVGNAVRVSLALGIRVRRRTRSFSESAIYTMPAVSTATPRGPPSIASVPAPPSPLKPCSPLPATVIMMPVLAVHSRIRLLLSSAMYTLPTASVVTPHGLWSAALTPTPPSPLKPGTPLPAIVVMIPVLFVHRRTRLLPKSAMYALPTASTATPFGVRSFALVAAPPSPL